MPARAPPACRHLLAPSSPREATPSALPKLAPCPMVVPCEKRPRDTAHWCVRAQAMVQQPPPPPPPSRLISLRFFMRPTASLYQSSLSKYAQLAKAFWSSSVHSTSFGFLNASISLLDGALMSFTLGFTSGSMSPLMSCVQLKPAK